MRNFRETYYDIKRHHTHSLKFLNSSIAFIDITNVQKRVQKKGVNSYDTFLSDWEHSYISDLKIPKRRMDFLCGRLAGKRAVRRHMLRNSFPAVSSDEQVQFRDIEIRRTVTGRPAVFIKDGSSRNGSSEFQISISHTEGVAASLVSNKKDCKGIGIDIERITERDASLMNVAFTKDEIEKLKYNIISGNGKGNDLFEEEVAKYWSIKEAVMKSLGVGVNIDLKDIEIINTDGYSSIVNLTRDAVGRYELLKGADIRVESTRIENFMISISCLY